MKSKVIKTVLCILAFILLGGIYKFINYQIDMYYAQVAARQVVDDSAYSILQLRDSVNSAVSWAIWILVFFTVFMLYKIWQKPGEVK